MKRPKYKQLYQDILTSRNRIIDERDRLQQRLNKIRRILAPIGLEIGKSIPDGDDAVSLNAHDYLCISEFMQTGRRWTGGEEDVDAGFQRLSWRGHPLHERAE